MHIVVKGGESTLAELSKRLLLTKTSILKAEAIEIAKEIANATPVDTGEAMRGWKTAEINGKVTISNTVPYVAILNQGHSKQAPALFIERVLLQHGKPIGVLVVTTPD